MDTVYLYLRNEILKIYKKIFDKWYYTPVHFYEKYNPNDYNKTRSQLLKIANVWMNYFDFSLDNLTDYYYVCNILFNICDLFEIQIDKKFFNNVLCFYKKTLLKIKFDNEMCTKIKNLLFCNNVNDLFEEFKKNYCCLKDFVFIKSYTIPEPTWKPINLETNFESSNKFFIFTPFVNNKINCVCHQTLNDPLNELKDSRAFSFDTNVISYWRSKLINKEINIDLEKLFSIIYNNGRIIFDYMPYLLENKLFENINPISLDDNLRLIEQDIYNHNNYYKMYYNFADYYKMQKERFEKLNYTYFLNLYREIYCQFLMLTYISLSKNIPSSDKLNYYIDWLEKMFDTNINYPLLYIATDYFNKKEVNFFKKIQTSAKNLYQKIKNMAWDIFHLQTQLVSLCNPSLKTEIYIPYFCTYDKDLYKLSKYFKIDSIAYISAIEEVFIKYHYCNYALLPNKYKNKIYHNNLNQFIDKEKIDKLIKKIEEQLSKDFNW